MPSKTYDSVNKNNQSCVCECQEPRSTHSLLRCCGGDSTYHIRACSCNISCLAVGTPAPTRIAGPPLQFRSQLPVVAALLVLSREVGVIGWVSSPSPDCGCLHSGHQTTSSIVRGTCRAWKIVDHLLVWPHRLGRDLCPFRCGLVGRICSVARWRLTTNHVVNGNSCSLRKTRAHHRVYGQL